MFIFKVYANILPANLLSFLKNVYDSHNTRKNDNKFKIRFTVTTQKAATICVGLQGPKMWNILTIDVKLCKTTVYWKKNIKLYYCKYINLELCKCS